MNGKFTFIVHCAKVISQTKKQILIWIKNRYVCNMFLKTQSYAGKQKIRNKSETLD